MSHAFTYTHTHTVRFQGGPLLDTATQEVITGGRCFKCSPGRMLMRKPVKRGEAIATDHLNRFNAALMRPLGGFPTLVATPAVPLFVYFGVGAHYCHTGPTNGKLLILVINTAL